MSGGDRITSRPVVPHVPEPDEDAEPRPLARLTVDLSGNYRDDPWGWIAYGAKKWRSGIGNFEGLALIMAAGTIFCWLPYTIFIRPVVLGEAFRIALRTLRDEPRPGVGAKRGWDDREGALLACSFLRLGIWAGAVAVWLSLGSLAEMAGLSILLAPVTREALGWAALVLLAVVAVYVQLRLSFTYPLIIEQRMSLLAAFAASWRMTRGHVLALAVLHSLLWLAFLAGFLSCGVGTFITAPLISLAEASAYMHATGQVPGPAPRGPPENRESGNGLE